MSDMTLEERAADAERQFRTKGNPFAADLFAELLAALRSRMEGEGGGMDSETVTAMVEVFARDAWNAALSHDRGVPVKTGDGAFERWWHGRVPHEAPEHPSVGFYRRLLALGMSCQDATGWLCYRNGDDDTYTMAELIDAGRADEVDAEINRLETGAH